MSAPALSSLFGVPLAGAPQQGSFSPDDVLADLTPPDVVLDVPAPPATGISTRNEPHTVPAPPGAAAPHGDAALAISNAMDMVGTDYVWGGTTAAGVDCSGLLFYAFNKAGIHMPRYRAVDYGHMGVPVSADQARPGDVVYFDNPGPTDHVGLYLGNGQFIEAPQPGEKVQVSALRRGAQIRRILPDSALHGLPVDPVGNLQFHGNNAVFTGGPAPADHPGAQRDPMEQLAALDAGGTLEGLTGSTGMSLDSIFGSALNPTGGPAPAGQPAQGGLTVGQATGLDEDEAWIVDHESDGRTDADNPTSTAAGIGQLTIANRRTLGRKLGIDPDTTDPGEQLMMMRAYIEDRYGTARAAREFWEAHGYY